MQNPLPDKDADGNTLTTHADPQPSGMADSQSGPDTAGPDMNQPMPTRPISMKMKKNMDKQRKMLGKLIVSMRKRNVRNQKALNSQLKALKKTIGDDNFEALKAIATTFYPEKKDEKGNVVQEAYNAVNYQALIAEAKHLIVLQREKRMKETVAADGTVSPRTRKRSSGRSSDRKAHGQTYKYIIDRGQKAVENKEEVSSVKV